VDTLNVPEGVRLVIGRRLERLSETARRILTTGAVVGQGLQLALLEQLETASGAAGLTPCSTPSRRPSARTW